MTAEVPALLASDSLVLPALVDGAGPSPDSRGRWIAQPDDLVFQRTAVALYKALVADVALALIGYSQIPTGGRPVFPIEGVRSRTCRAEIGHGRLHRGRREQCLLQQHAPAAAWSPQRLTSARRPARSRLRPLRTRWREEAERSESRKRNSS